MKIKTLLNLAFLILVGVTADAAQSQWVYYNASSNLVYNTWYRGTQIMDFSYAGYMGGGVALPTVATAVTLNPSGGDDKAALQNAINTVAAMPLTNGFRGAVQLGAGTFLVSGQINLNASGVVVRGAGSGTGGTVISMTAASPTTLFNIAGTGTPSQSGAVNITNTYIPSGSRSFNVTSTSGFSVGNTVIVNRAITTNWCLYLGMPTDNSWLHIGGWLTTDRVIQNISGTQITLDAPLTDSFDWAYLGNPVGNMAHYTYTGRISQVGLEHLRILEPAVMTDYTGINMDVTIDSWVRDVVIQDGANNVEVGKNAKRITFDTVTVSHTIANTNDAGPTDFGCTGTQILFNKCQSMGSRYWAFTTGSGGTGPIVVLNHYSSETSGISPHQRWTTGILADNCSFPNAPINTQGIAYDNRGAGSGQGWTTGWSVAWNVITPYFLVSAAPGTENWCIGGVGQETTNSDPTGIYDSLGTQVTLGATGSLYLEQLRARLGTNALFNIGYYDYGTYKIQNVTSGLVLNQQGSLTNGSAINQWANVSSPNLEFTFIHTTNNGYYQINSVKSGLDVAVQGASTANGANIIQYAFGSTGDDQWKLVQNSDGTLAFYNLHSGLVLNNTGGSLTNGTQYSQWSLYVGSPNEEFNLIKQ